MSREARLHKVLAHCGVGSRRECEKIIEQGRVVVNGKPVTKVGTKVDPDRDELRVDGEKVQLEESVYYLVHKPRGYVCTSRDPEGRPRILDLLRDDRHRLYTVGRLDAESEGLILLTNDGEITNVICHPRYQVDKTYRLTVQGEVRPEQVARVERGVWLAEGRTGPAEVRRVRRRGERTELLITLWEGRNRELRRILGRVGLQVTHLVRTAIGPLRMEGLPVGRCRRLDPKELAFARCRLSKEWQPEAGPRPRPPAAGRRPRRGDARRPLRGDRPRRGPGRGAPRRGGRAER
ncbi:MAG: pseudouridine synthase [Planctomycetota bacterium]